MTISEHILEEGSRLVTSSMKSRFVVWLLIMVPLIIAVILTDKKRLEISVIGTVILLVVVGIVFFFLIMWGASRRERDVSFLCPHCTKAVVDGKADLQKCPSCESIFYLHDLVRGCPTCKEKLEYYRCMYCQSEIDLLSEYNPEEIRSSRRG